MIKRISLKNYKQFVDYSILCRDSNILVGPNNSGKSSILDALRVCSDVLRYANRRSPTLASHGDHGVCATYTIEHSLISIPIDNVSRNYSESDAEIEIFHENGSKLQILLHPDHSVKVALVSPRGIPRTINQFHSYFPMNIVVVPTLGPLDEDETYVQDDTVRRNEYTRLSRRNFRNIWLRKSDEEFSEFSTLISESWSGMVIKKPHMIGGYQNLIEMKFEENRIPREVYWAGFGFQVWMQMITHVMRGNETSVLVLDEPDVYLHPDLQHKLLQLVGERFGQTFMATHSTELINEANPGDILSIESSKRSARRISSESDFRDIYSYIGSSENAEFARMARAKRVVFFEGKDRKIFRKFATKLNRTEALNDPDTVYLQAGGFEQWRRVKELNWTLESMFGMSVKIAAIFDRDFRSDDEIVDFLEKMNGENLITRVLGRKEIENYALERDSLIRLVRKRALERGTKLEPGQIMELVDETTESLRTQVLSQLTAKYLFYAKSQNPKLDESTILKAALLRFDESWIDPELRLKMIPGKDFISTLSSTLQLRYKVSITATQLINEMQLTEVQSDLGELMTELGTFFEA